MKWTRPEIKRGPNERSGFLLFPKTIDGETRWLEFARWEVKFCMTMATGTPYFRPVRWLP